MIDPFESETRFPRHLSQYFFTSLINFLTTCRPMVSRVTSVIFIIFESSIVIRIKELNINDRVNRIQTEWRNKSNDRVSKFLRQIKAKQGKIVSPDNLSPQTGNVGFRSSIDK